uniref:Uncharacterized protein n=1 Tax=Heterorhabditis bacteriophora TaxID=37862 RepID=A0A1I7WD43_HETBA
MYNKSINFKFFNFKTENLLITFNKNFKDIKDNNKIKNT